MFKLKYQRGDIFWVSLDPTIGSETKKTRPAVIVSNNSQNLAAQRVIVAPMTSVVTKIYPFEMLITIENKESKIMADQLRTVDCSRLGVKLSSLTIEQIRDLDRIIKLVLSLP